MPEMIDAVQRFGGARGALPGRVLSWAPDVDDKTLHQAAQCARLPFVHPHVALMPDAHFGYGSTVGSVIPSRGAIVPSAIGVDIGCGMIASRVARNDGPLTPVTAADLPDSLSLLHHLISRSVPAGVGRGHQEGQGILLEIPDINEDAPWWSDRLQDKARKQFGSLGSGNHFVEVCLDERDYVWVVLHSGSRGVGNELANIHIDGAKGAMKEWFIELPSDDLAYLVEGRPEFDSYIADMLWAQDYALGNRAKMMSAVMDQLEVVLGASLVPSETINCHHNFTEMENHMGKNLWITRKGAIRAREGDRGVIPGSMGAESFIVSGLGNPATFHSCSHGAGRTMSRSQARKLLTAESLASKMEGVAWNVAPEQLLDEHPDAYKDIHQVMANQADLVKIEHTLHQVLNYKGN